MINISEAGGLLDHLFFVKFIPVHRYANSYSRLGAIRAACRLRDVLIVLRHFQNSVATRSTGPETKSILPAA